MNICHIFKMKADEAWASRDFELVENYGRSKYGNILHDCEDGSRALMRCRKCGALVVHQNSAFGGTGPDAYFDTIWPVTDAEGADNWNKIYSGDLKNHINDRPYLENIWSEYRKEREQIRFHGNDE